MLYFIAGVVATILIAAWLWAFFTLGQPELFPQEKRFVVEDKKR